MLINSNVLYLPTINIYAKNMHKYAHKQIQL